MAEREDRGAGGLGQQCLPACNDPRDVCRRGEAVLQHADHDVVEHLVFLDQRNPCLKVDEENVRQTVPLLHQFGCVVTARHDAVNILVGNLGNPLEAIALFVHRNGAMLPRPIIKPESGIV